MMVMKHWAQDHPYWPEMRTKQAPAPRKLQKPLNYVVVGPFFSVICWRRLSSHQQGLLDMQVAAMQTQVRAKYGPLMTSEHAYNNRFFEL